MYPREITDPNMHPFQGALSAWGATWRIQVPAPAGLRSVSRSCPAEGEAEGGAQPRVQAGEGAREGPAGPHSGADASRLHAGSRGHQPGNPGRPTRPQPPGVCNLYVTKKDFMR